MGVFIELRDAHDASLAGAKAAALAGLVAAGLSVPDGVVVRPDAPVETPTIWARMAPGPVAVRSSGLAEDGVHASHAGVFESVLGVDSADALIRAIGTVRASADSDRAVAYGAAGTPMAVLVQRQVDPRSAGVAFSTDPVTGRRDQVRIGAVVGLGEALVDGTTDGDEWIVGARTIPVRTAAGALDAPGAQTVADLARRAEAHVGRPVEIEWAWDGITWWLLQARPITA